MRSLLSGVVLSIQSDLDATVLSVTVCCYSRPLVTYNLYSIVHSYDLLLNIRTRIDTGIFHLQVVVHFVVIIDGMQSVPRADWSRIRRVCFGTFLLLCPRILCRRLNLFVIMHQGAV